MIYNGIMIIESYFGFYYRIMIFVKKFYILKKARYQYEYSDYDWTAIRFGRA